MKLKTWIIDFLKGATLGIGLLPGVSAGTIGITVGIYDKLIGGVNGLKKQFVRSLLVLLPIMLGWVIFGVVLLYLEHLTWDRFPFIIVLTCAGLTIGGIPVIWKEFRSHSLSGKDFIYAGIGFALAVLIGVLSVLAKINHWFDVEAAFLDPNANIWIYFVTILIGIVAMGACIVPGISGAMILFIFGLYQPVLDLFMGNNSMFHNHDRLTTGLILAGCLVLGIVIGLLGVSKIMKFMLDKHHAGTFDVVFGFVLGSIVSMFVNNQIWDSYFNPEVNVWWQWLIGGACFAVAFALTFFLVRKSLRKNDKCEKPSESVENSSM